MGLAGGVAAWRAHRRRRGPSTVLWPALQGASVRMRRISARLSSTLRDGLSLASARASYSRLALPQPLGGGAEDAGGGGEAQSPRRSPPRGSGAPAALQLAARGGPEAGGRRSSMLLGAAAAALAAQARRLLPGGSGDGFEDGGGGDDDDDDDLSRDSDAAPRPPRRVSQWDAAP